MPDKIQVCPYKVNRHAVPSFIHNRGMETVGQRIRKLRVARKLTQAQLAKALGITQASVTDLEQGRSKSPASSTLTKLARFFEVDPEWLMTGKGPQHAVSILTDQESELVLLFRSISSEGRAYILGRTKTVHKDESDRSPPQRRHDDPDPPSPRPSKSDGH